VFRPPELKLMVTFKLLASASVESLPKASCVLTAGCTPKGAPAIAEAGCVANTNRFTAAGPTTTVSEVAPARLPLLKLIVILVAALWNKFVKVTRPLTTVRLVVPCKVPAARVARGHHHRRVVARSQVAELIFNPDHRLLGKHHAPLSR